MQVFDHLNPGDRATWETFNGIVKGTVESVGPRGVLVRIDGGGNMILSTTESYKNFIERKKQCDTQVCSPESEALR